MHWITVSTSLIVVRTRIHSSQSCRVNENRQTTQCNPEQWRQDLNERRLSRDGQLVIRIPQLTGLKADNDEKALENTKRILLGKTNFRYFRKYVRSNKNSDKIGIPGNLCAKGFFYKSKLEVISCVNVEPSVTPVLFGCDCWRNQLLVTTNFTTNLKWWLQSKTRGSKCQRFPLKSGPHPTKKTSWSRQAE